jgi:hypothetical protein
MVKTEPTLVIAYDDGVFCAVTFMKLSIVNATFVSSVGLLRVNLISWSSGSDNDDA